ncbi:type I 3-dehydroquinate dehydratase [Clostridioides mangenotii]|uniref:type I 3-dehydroquinate dehydratase n=1 Tax=Metaclostridioides mangenotii TaxID=1540 RepID=UPI001C101E24|nr:type I 3-dehydroquinate dehydratase [Clostridioides mangenotii]MBU5306701.1 type I 3-dehydroquinate dehydratase [Clostridioides mangenotii]
MNTVTVKNIVFGAGKPKVCVPIVGRNLPSLKEEAKLLKNLEADLIEWRVDFFEEVTNIEEAIKALFVIKKEIDEIPLLFTFRSEKEGGEQCIEDEFYFKLYEEIIKIGEVDIIDIELFNEEASLKKLIKSAHRSGVKVIISNHDFEKTPSEEEIISRLCKMQNLGADLPKISVMPNSSDDVLTLLAATNTMNKKFAKRPIITMSMGSLGVISRLSGEVFGSCMTFGSAKFISAPGQVDVKELMDILEVLHIN